MAIKLMAAEIPLNLVLFEIVPRLPIKSLARFMCVCKQWKSFLSTICIMLFEILPRLPLKVVARFMLVCKQWKTFLSTPEFARLHLRHVSRYKLLLLVNTRPRTFRTIDCKAPNSITNRRYIPFFADHNNGVFILASLDGLVCLASKKTQELAFWNPLTGACKILPRFSDRWFYKPSCDTIGLYNDSSNDFKLLYIASGGVLGAFIYSLRLDSWRKIEYHIVNTDCFYSYKWSSAALLGQNLYFVLNNDYEHQSCIISFDGNLEKFIKIPFPLVPSGALSHCGGLVVFNGCIHLCVAYKLTMTNSSEVDFWRMDSDVGGWVKVRHFSDVQPRLPGLRQIRITRNGNFSESIDSFNNINMEDFARHYLCLDAGGRKSSFQQTIYVETLVSPN